METVGQLRLPDTGHTAWSLSHTWDCYLWHWSHWCMQSLLSKDWQVPVQVPCDYSGDVCWGNLRHWRDTRVITWLVRTCYLAWSYSLVQRISTVCCEVVMVATLQRNTRYLIKPLPQYRNTRCQQKWRPHGAMILILPGPWHWWVHVTTLVVPVYLVTVTTDLLHI